MNTGSGEHGGFPVSTQSDDSLIEMIRLRDERGLESLFAAHATLVYSVALRVLHDQSAAEDVLQDVFLRVWREPDSFVSARGSLRSWLTVVARNRSIDLLRSRKPSESIDDVPLASPYDLAEVAERRLLLERVRAVIAELPEEQRMSLELAFFDGLTHVEIAERTGTPLGTIKTRIRSALGTLGKAFPR